MDDEEDDGGEGFQVKKSKESRKFKKMRQAPGIAEIVTTEVVIEKTVAHELGGTYSADNLAKLRQSQLFVAQQQESEPMLTNSNVYESVELSGEAAEEFVEKMELEAAKKNNNLGEYVSLNGSADLDAIHAGRLNNKVLLKGNKDSERLYTSNLNKGGSKIAYDLALDNDSEWEEEIIRRGVINKTALSEENKAITEKASRAQTNPNTRSANSTAASTSILGEISIGDLIRSVQLAVEKLSHNEEGAIRKIEQIQSDAAQALSEESELRTKVEVGVKKLNLVQVSSYF